LPDLASLSDPAVALLRELSAPFGIHASSAETANYRAIFTRDAVMAGVAGLLIGDSLIVGGLVRTLDQLRELQGREGQVPSNFEVRLGGAPQVSFGSLAPRLDAATWYLVGVGLAARAGAIDASSHATSVHRAVSCLAAIEYNGRHLLYVPTGGNWADEYIFEGYILYDQVLRAWALRLLAPVYGEPAWSTKAAQIESVIADRYFTANLAQPQHPLAAFTPIRQFAMFDLAACALLGVSGIASVRAQQALRWIDAHFLQQAQLPPAFHPTIEEGDPDWPALSRYHLHGFRNRPYEYHNGGIWPIWLGWLSLALARHGHADALERLRIVAARALASLPEFAFEEYLHGRTGAPGGTPHMAYTATGITLLRIAASGADAALLWPPSDIVPTIVAATQS